MLCMAGFSASALLYLLLPEVASRRPISPYRHGYHRWSRHKRYNKSPCVPSTAEWHDSIPTSHDFNRWVWPMEDLSGRKEGRRLMGDKMWNLHRHNAESRLQTHLPTIPKKLHRTLPTQFDALQISPESNKDLQPQSNRKSDKWALDNAGSLVLCKTLGCKAL